jgi:thiamine-phosphate pyrophosphorylase
VTRPALPRGLYVITDARLCGDGRLRDAVSEALAGGARSVQYRDKSEDRARRAQEAHELAGLCRGRGAVLIVNDDVHLARAAGAHGVHLGEDDASVPEARAILGASAIIGVSCYDSLQRAERAASEGADYVAFGSFYPSLTKPHARRASLELLASARERVGLPIVAIGGITPANARALVAAGAHALAVVSGVFAAADLRRAARAYAELYENGATGP